MAAPVNGRTLRRSLRAEVCHLEDTMRLTRAGSLLRRLGVVALLALTVAHAPGVQAQSATTLATGAAPTLGTFLTDQAGRTLYMYTRDSVGISNCYDACAAAWPPLTTQ